MDTRTFWTRMTLASVVLNLPVAVAIMAVGVPLIAGVAASSLLGVGALTVLDRQRTARSTASAELLMELRVTGPATQAAPPRSADLITSA